MTRWRHRVRRACSASSLQRVAWRGGEGYQQQASMKSRGILFGETLCGDKRRRLHDRKRTRGDVALRRRKRRGRGLLNMAAKSM